MKRSNILWIGALLLGWLLDFLFWGHAPGINFAIYVTLCLAGGFLVLGLNGLRPSWRTLVLLVPILFFAVMTFLRAEPMSVFLAVVLTLGMLSLLAASYLGGRWPWYGLLDYAANTAKLIGSTLAQPLMLLTANKKAAPLPGTAGAGARKAGWKRFWAVLRGLLIALPIVAIFAALLSSADLVFAQRLQDFIQLFRLEKLPEYIFRGFYILVVAYLLAGTLLHAGLKSRDEKLIGLDKPVMPPFLGFTEASVVLGAVVLLFAAFVMVQFQYFFGGQTNIGIQGYTFSEYARRGFGELVTVAFFSLLLFLGLSAIVKRGNPVQRRVFSGLGLGMVALVGVMLVSAFQRLVLYEAAYGFSRLRTYTHVFMLWLGLLLAAVVVLDLLHKERLFAFSALLAAIGFAASLSILNVDGFIVRQNVQRTAAGQKLDAGYLASLSNDAIPDLVTAYLDPSLPAADRDALGAALVCSDYRNSGRTPDTNWRAFSLTDRLAAQALERLGHQLEAYRLLTKDYPIQVRSPLGEIYDCYSSASGE